MKLMTGNSNLPLAKGIADYMNLPLTDASVRRFADNEIFVEIHENVRGEDMFVIQSTSHPANDNLMELLIMMMRCAVHRQNASPRFCPISAMHGRIANPGHARPFPQSLSPI